mgnify:CR=1 FL=1
MKHLSSALTAIRRSPYQALSAVLLVSITFFVAYTCSIFFFGTEQVLRYFETRPQITAFFQLDADAVTLQQVEKTMKEKPYVDRVTMTSKEQALQIYREDNKKDPLLLELVTADILPASIEVSSKDVGSLVKIKEDLEKSAGIEEVVFQQDVVDTLESWTNSIRYIGVASVAILAFTSLLLIIIITGLKVVNRRRAIQIMRILGASKWYVKAPFIYEGMLYGLFGSFLGWSMMYVGVLYLTPWLKNFLGEVPLFPLAWSFFAAQLGTGSLVGILLGAFASSIATQRIMRHS